jgi:hypothetical protein
MSISTLQPAFEYGEAWRRLSSSGIEGLLRRWWRGQTRGIAKILIPYRLYKVTVSNRGSVWSGYYGVDAASGALDPYEFSSPVTADSFNQTETANCHPVRLDEEETARLALEKVRRLVYVRGFFHLYNPRITCEPAGGVFYIQYWAGFYGDDRNLNMVVVNGVRGTVEGGKVRRLIRGWLLEPGANATVAA